MVRLVFSNLIQHKHELNISNMLFSNLPDELSENDEIREYELSRLTVPRYMECQPNMLQKVSV